MCSACWAGEEAILALINIGALDSWGVLILVIGLIFLMGFFFDVLEILLIAMPIFGPIVAPLDFGVHIAQADVVYWFAILVAITLQTSFLTPPMGLSLFYIKGVAPEGLACADHRSGSSRLCCCRWGVWLLVMWQPGLVLSLPKLLFESQAVLSEDKTSMAPVADHQRDRFARTSLRVGPIGLNGLHCWRGRGMAGRSLAHAGACFADCV